MIWTDIRNKADGGTHNLTETGRLAPMADAHFDDRSLVFGGEAKQRVRHPNTVIEVSFRFERPPALGQDARHHVFRRRFSVAAGDSHHGNREPTSMVRRQLLISE